MPKINSIVPYSKLCYACQYSTHFSCTGFICADGYKPALKMSFIPKPFSVERIYRIENTEPQVLAVVNHYPHSLSIQINTIGSEYYCQYRSCSNIIAVADINVELIYSTVQR